jgi:hypothetical protein
MYANHPEQLKTELQEATPNDASVPTSEVLKTAVYGGSALPCSELGIPKHRTNCPYQQRALHTRCHKNRAIGDYNNDGLI